MTKNEMKDLMFDVLNDHDSLFKDVTLSDALVYCTVDIQSNSTGKSCSFIV